VDVIALSRPERRNALTPAALTDLARDDGDRRAQQRREALAFGDLVARLDDELGEA